MRRFFFRVAWAMKSVYTNNVFTACIFTKRDILEPDRFVIVPLEATVLFKTDRDQTILDHFVRRDILEPDRFVTMLLEATVLFKTDRNQTILDHFVRREILEPNHLIVLLGTTVLLCLKTIEIE